MDGFSSSSDESGFWLVEVLIASALLMTALVAVAQLFAVATNANRAARNSTVAVTLAGQKLEQLRGLTWGFDLCGLPLSDTTTDLSVTPANPAGGRGLTPSPPGTLLQNTPGYVDYLDEYGNWVGNGATPPPRAVYVRRWSIEPLPTNPNDTLVLQVLVTLYRARSAADVDAGTWLRDGARILSVKTRKSS